MGRFARAQAHSALAVAVVLASVSAARAQFVFDPPVNFSFDFEAWPTSIGHGDFNDDGLIDLAVSGRNVDGLMLILMGSEETGFGPAIPLPIGKQTDWVVAKFLDTDSHWDLGIAQRAGVGKAAVLKGTGGGAFVERVDYPVGRNPSHMVARDFDGDGDMDLATMDTGSATVTLLRNDGNAVFTSTGQINHIGRLDKGLSGGFYLTAADFDGNLSIDVAVARGSGHITVLTNGGDAIFAKPLHYNIAGTATGIAAGDVDDDGDIDIVFGDLTLEAPGFLGVLRNQGNGQFGNVAKFPMPGHTMWFVALADLDGDGLLDPIVTDAFGSRLFLFHNESAEGQLAFADPQEVVVGGFPRSVFAVDLDGDCDLDLLVANISSHRVQVLINNTPQAKPCRSAAAGRPPVRFVARKEAQTKTKAPRRPVLTDINADGRIDAADLAAALQEWR